MKYKDSSEATYKTPSLIHKNFTEFVESEIPKITKKKKNTEKKVPNSEISLKKRIKNIKNMKHYPIELNYYTKYGSTFGDYL